MKYTRRFFILLLFLAVVPALNGAQAKTSVARQLARCAAISNEQQRLACYDELARKVSSNAGQSPGLHFIQPPASFLDSRLVSAPWKAQYTLTVRSFVKLISQAVMGNGKKISIQGWTRDERHYVLNITMRTPVKLRFLPREVAKKDTPMSLLKEVTMDGETVSAEEFIMVIAAMVPF
ncbi:MAG: hypothetical protein PVJ39_00720 [Gammaproteobacteria bacterium]